MTDNEKLVRFLARIMIHAEQGDNLQLTKTDTNYDGYVEGCVDTSRDAMLIFASIPENCL